VETLKLLVDEFSNFARLPAANPNPDDLNRIVSDAVASYAGTEGVSLETELDPALPPVELDREQMRRALTNLIDHPIAATRRGGPGRGGRRARRAVRSGAPERAPHGVRRRHRHPRAGPPARVRAVLLAQRERHRPRARDRLAHRRGPPRLRARAGQPAARHALR